MSVQGKIGGAIFGVGMVGFGVVSLVRRDAVPDLEPLPVWLPGRLLIAMLVAVILVAAGGALVANWRAARAGGAIGAVLSAWLVALHLPRIVQQPKNGGFWVVFWEVAAMTVAAWMVASTTPEDDASQRVLNSARSAIVLRVVLGLAFVSFGISHFVYHGYVESVIPTWIPGHVFFAYATGIAHIAAGLSLIARVQDQLATALLAVMFGSWVVVLHIPRALAHPTTGNEWSSLFVAVAMCGGALIARTFLAAHVAQAHASTSDGRALPGLQAIPWRSRS